MFEIDFHLPKFSLDSVNMEAFKRHMAKHTKTLSKLTDNVGQTSDEFQITYRHLCDAIRAYRFTPALINSHLMVRALSLAINDSELNSKINFSRQLLEQIDSIQVKPSALITTAMTNLFLQRFDQLTDVETLGDWLIKARELRKQSERSDKHIFSIEGPKWLANSAIKQQDDLNSILKDNRLEQYTSGKFLSDAHSIYFVKQLQKIPVNQPHKILDEVIKKDVFTAKYDRTMQVGHKVLEILIDRANTQELDKSWEQVILTIAGDPRVASNSAKYQQWWNKLGKSRIQKVIGWLSRLDLKLFLEVLEDFSKTSGNTELIRMYPSRKNFLEGVFEKDLVENSRLYLSRQAERYLKLHYKKDELPNYSVVSDQDKSIIYLKLKNAHVIEGSHSCYLWIYPNLHEDALVFNYNRTTPSYSELTNGLAAKMAIKGCRPSARIQHNPTNFNWQYQGVEALKSLGMNVTGLDVLSTEDYKRYKRLYGAV
ncbi:MULTISPECIES: EH signature domain-containing protein [unclassified Shewanella]|uniref:EH signature domain-containing protein n=1 Tax=unclassified Shewanella TaxID=196818 RepID=UPI001BC40C5D|nr:MULTISPECIES: EH signature domain-containing protein [unclassified Shewanella]GIU15823.1 transcriptional regulator [Shewanella sp. MBTL60-112-B1]GIU39468.1 transcriptional regulator [Shewanella sp. MBTL60-112-B2]